MRRTMPPPAIIRTVGPGHAFTAYSSRAGDSRLPWFIASLDAYLCSQVALKFVPPERAEIESFCVLPDFIMISVGLKLPMAEPLAAELVKFAVPKLASGRIPPEPVQQGASTMTSADDRLAEDSVLFSVWLQPRVVSEMVRVNLPPPSKVTEAVKLSPGLTGLLKVCEGPGYISHQA